MGNSCQSYWQRTLWDGDQILYEWRTPDGTSTGMNSGYAGYVHVEGLDQPLGLIRSDGTRVLNYNWRGLGESSVFTNGAAGDASITSGLPAVDWPTRTQGAVYFTPNVLASGPSGPFTWFGTLAENGAGSAGLLYKRNRYFDPASGRFTQADPIGLGGGLNLYGFANGDPVNFSDPFGLCTIQQRLCHWIEATSMAVGSFGGFIAGGGAPALTGVGVIASPFTAAAGMASGAAWGLGAGKAITSALFSENASAGRSGGGESNTRDLQGRLDAHRQKLEAYRRDPDAFDNKGFLKNAPNEEIRNRIIQGRIRHLETEIRAFEKGIRDAGGTPR